MDVDRLTIERMLRVTAGALLGEAEEIEESLSGSSMKPEAELLWFGWRPQDRIDKLLGRWSRDPQRW